MLDRISAQGDIEEMYLAGIVTLPKPDVEGGVYENEDIDVHGLVEEGYLDVNHLMFEHGVQEAVIGEPVEIRQTKAGTWVKFKLHATQLARDIWNYVREHPGLLGFSIAGGLAKPLFERGGKWHLDRKHNGSVGICRFPMNPGTFAYATSRAALAATSGLGEQGLLRIMLGLVPDLRRGVVGVTTDYEGWYGYFAHTGLNPLAASTVATWATSYFHGLAESRTLIDQIKDTVMIDPEDDADLGLGIEESMVRWLAAHPDDAHFTSEGRFRNLDAASAHLRLCEQLSPLQAARILGAMRQNPTKYLAHPPSGWLGKEISA